MSTKEDVKAWSNELHELAKRFGESERTGWLVQYTNLKEDVLEGCSLGRYANGLQIAETIIGSFGGYETLATLFAEMSILDNLLRGIIEMEEKE